MSTPRSPRPSSRPWWTWYAVGAAIAAVSLGLMVWQVVARGPFIAWDWPFHEAVDPRVPTGGLKTAADVLASALGQRKYTLPFIALAAAFTAWRLRSLRPVIATGAGLAAVAFVGYAIKGALQRTPPALEVDMLHGEGEAFPSGHTANATLTWVMFVVLMFSAHGAFPNRRRFRIGLAVALFGAFVGGVLMAVLDYHWLSDIPGGWALGGLAICAAMVAFGPAPAYPGDDTPAPATGVSGTDDGDGDGGDALAPAGEAQSVRGGPADRHGSPHSGP